LAFGFNPRAVAEGIRNGEKNLFYEIDPSDVHASELEEVLYVPWQEADLLSIPSIIFDECLHDDISEWTLSRIRYSLSVTEHTGPKFSFVVYEYTKLDDSGKHPVLITREFLIHTESAYVGFYESGDELQMIPTAKDLRNRQVSTDEAMRIAEENGAKQFRDEHDIKLWFIDMEMSSDGNWEVWYSAGEYYKYVVVNIQDETGEVRVTRGEYE
jgi:hypothetical protein